MLKGLQWSDFTFYKGMEGLDKSDIEDWLKHPLAFSWRYFYAPCGIWFKATIMVGESNRPSLRVRTTGFEGNIVFKFIRPETLEYLKGDIQSALRWSHLNQLGPVVRSDE